MDWSIGGTGSRARIDVLSTATTGVPMHAASAMVRRRRLPAGGIDPQAQARHPAWSRVRSERREVGRALDPEIRRAHQHDLLGEYLDQLGAAGVHDAPTPAAAFELCRAAAQWGLVIGWLICPPENYGQPITEANISRAVTAVQDLDTFAAIEERR